MCVCVCVCSFVRLFVCFTNNKGNSSTKSWESQHSVFSLLTKIFKTNFPIVGFIKIIPLFEHDMSSRGLGKVRLDVLT